MKTHFDPRADRAGQQRAKFGRIIPTLLVFALSAVPASASTLRTSGSRLLDRCGNPLVVRGVEQILGKELPPGNDWVGLVREIASTNVNAIRVLPGVQTLSVDDVDEVLSAIGEADLVAYIAPLSDDGTWLGRSDVRQMLARHEGYILIDAYGEPQYDDIERFRRESVAAIREVRNLGYRVPLTVTANQFGRDLPSILEYGAEILAADPLSNTVLGWQAYWGRGGYYQDHYGMTFDEAVNAIVRSALPIQLGLDYVTDLPSETMDYGALMRLAQTHGIGWLWWDWYNPYGRDNNLSLDGSAQSLTSTGLTVISEHAASIENTARRACRPATAAPAIPPVSDPPPAAARRLSINSGGGAEGWFLADDPFSGANVSGGRRSARSESAIDRSLVPAPAPAESIYQTAREGQSSYVLNGFAPQAAHVVQLHFAELLFPSVGARRFDVRINGERALVDYDIVQRAGAAHRAIQENFAANADSNGEIEIRFETGWAGEPSINAIVITEWPTAWR